MRCHEDMVMLRKTMGSYDKGRIWGNHDSLHRGCLGDISSERVVGCRHDASPMFDIPGSTPMWAQCILFSGFEDIKTYVYVYCF